MTMRVAVIGDNFMRTEFFCTALKAVIKTPLELSVLDLPFPDQPVTQNSQDPAFATIKEFQGTAEQVLSVAAGAEALITHIAPLTAEMLELLPDLRFVGVSRGGPVNVDRQALKARNIRLVNTPGRNATAVAEFTIGALIAETRNIAKGHAALKQGQWLGDLYRADVQRKEISQMTVGIIGYSNIGKRVGQLLKAFSARILVSDPYITLDKADIEYGVRQVELDELLKNSDAITLHAPATPDTVGMINQAALSKMPRGAVLVNTSRGSLVDEPALIEALSSGHLSGAVLDTYAVEPLPADSPLLSLPNVLITPHNAGASQTTVKIAADMIAEEFRRYTANVDALNPC